MRITHPYRGGEFKPGDYWTTCDRCGHDYRRSELVLEDWSGLLVCTLRGCLDPEPETHKRGRRPKRTEEPIDFSR